MPHLRNREKKITNSTFNTYMKKAAKRNLVFELERSHFDELLGSPCYLCGVRSAGGVDRTDNTVGYTVENAMPCCKTCNFLKGTLPLCDVLTRVDEIVFHHGV
ncbi:uncharacterized protein ACA1_077910 [Acanthamoeba castellanii str. Neff]|uniref:Uncharacterized protein n=1 Tax=Acanthamoeba castellanii (strain ATCC 30010 / Neff) TaxID=1257118 RepID=L8GNC2_ACACF|nr:uncharacterized protein ACA1_077910 [Acanthamoeba castellanii str. Neff]ELR14560.1 hypothetical protein ACA1_077910 [Acanthamoeba castellanii str. Neff]